MPQVVIPPIAATYSAFGMFAIRIANGGYIYHIGIGGINKNAVEVPCPLKPHAFPGFATIA